MSEAVPKERTVLVTGAAGTIGRRLLPALRRAGLRTRSLVHKRPAGGGDEVVRGDVTDFESLRGVFDGVTAVVHLAAVTHSRSARAYELVNTEGTRTLLAAAPPTLERFVHVSTRAAAPDGGAYSLSKLAAEDVVRASAVPWVIIRPGEVYGGMSKGVGVDDILRRARRGAPVLVVGRGDQELCPVHIDDLVAGLVAAVQSPQAVGQLYTLAGECMTVREFAARASGAFGTRSLAVGVPRRVVAALSVASRYAPLPLYPDQLAMLYASKSHLGGDAAADLGFVARPPEVALQAADVSSSL